MNRTQGPAPIEFWFDFASGYAYFAALEIEALAERHGRNVLWRPFTLGAAFKVTGAQGLSRTPLKGEYARRDWQRLARLKGVVFKLPERHPKAGLAAIRAFYHIERLDSPVAGRFAKHAIIGYFRDGLDTDDPNAIAQMASALLGVDRDSVLAGISDSEVKAIARQHGEAAVTRGVFGSPLDLRRWRTVLGQRPSRHGGAMAWWRTVVARGAGDFLGCHYRPCRVRVGASDPKQKLRNLRVVSEITWSSNFR